MLCMDEPTHPGSDGMRIAPSTGKGHAHNPSSDHRTRRRVIMDFAVILILSNTLMAVLIYIVITKIWQD